MLVPRLLRNRPTESRRSDGGQPYGGVIASAAGALFGTAGYAGFAEGLNNEPVLSRFLTEQRTANPDIASSLPAHPPVGSLNVEDVLRSAYFFCLQSWPRPHCRVRDGYTGISFVKGGGKQTTTSQPINANLYVLPAPSTQHPKPVLIRVHLCLSVVPFFQPTILYGRIISLSSCSKTWQCQT